MDWLSNVSPVWREYFLGAAGDATGGLVAQFVIGLLQYGQKASTRALPLARANPCLTKRYCRSV